MFVSTACNRELRNSEAFVGNYSGKAVATGEFTLYDSSNNIISMTPVNSEFDNNFYIKLGEKDNEIIICNIVGESFPELTATVNGKYFIIEQKRLPIDVTLDLYVLVPGNGTREGENIKYSLNTFVGANNIVSSYTYNIILQGEATKY